MGLNPGAFTGFFKGSSDTRLFHVKFSRAYLFLRSLKGVRSAFTPLLISYLKAIRFFIYNAK